MDKSLDEIITSNKPKGVRRTSSRRTGRQEILGKPTTSPVARARINNPIPGGAKAAAASPQPADKIMVSNLPLDVNEVQVKELFHTTVGPLREVTLHYDANGRSKGVASVHFQRRGDGTKAYQQYNNRLIDGKRPMKIEVIVDPARLPPAPSLASRVAPAAEAAANGTQGSRRPGGTRGGGVGRGGRRPRRSERPPKTVADLDAEMEDYTATSNGPAAPAATTA